MISVVLVDDHPVVRSGIRAVLSTAADISVVAEAATGEAAVAVVAETAPDVVVCDLRLGAGMDGIATTAAIGQLASPPAVLILSTYHDDADVAAALAAGAAGYVLKEAAPEEIIAALRTVAAGGTAVSPQLATQMASNLRQHRPELTARQLEVLRLVATGASNKQIAAQLYVTEATVKSHLVHIFTKLDANSRTHALHVAQELGLL